MEISLRGFSHVRLNTFKVIAKNWKEVFTNTEKISLLLVAFLLVLTSGGWVYADSQLKNSVPTDGGTYIEGVVASSVDSVDLGRLTKAGLTRIDSSGKVSPDLAASWAISSDQLTYKFTLVSKVSSYDIASLLKENPSYADSASAQTINSKTLALKLATPNANFLTDLSQAVFPYGPYLVDRTTDNEIRLKKNADYYANPPYIDRFIIRIYPNQSALQDAADHDRITGALGLTKTPDNWRRKELTLGQRHYLFVNSSKPNLKSTAVRQQILSGQKSDGITSLDVLEVNGKQEDADFINLLAKLKASGVDIHERKVSLKDALKSDLPQRNYDLLYILVSEGQTHDPYLFYDSTQRSGVGQNFGELADAGLDKLLESYQTETDPTKQAALLDQINTEVNSDAVSITYPSLKVNYDFSSKLKGFSASPIISSESDRFAQVLLWHFYEKRVK